MHIDEKKKRKMALQPTAVHRDYSCHIFLVKNDYGLYQATIGRSLR